jgi:hypothetical protein
VERSGHGLIWGTILAFVWSDWGSYKNFSQDSRCPGWDLSWALPECKPEASLLEPTCSVIATSANYYSCCHKMKTIHLALCKIEGPGSVTSLLFSPNLVLHELSILLSQHFGSFIRNTVYCVAGRTQKYEKWTDGKFRNNFECQYK